MSKLTRPFLRIAILYNNYELAKQKAVTAPSTQTHNDLIKAKALLLGYQSRGHGKSRTQAAPKHKHMSVVRAAKAKHNKAKRG